MIRFLTAGESHGEALTAILEGIPAGLPLTTALINHELARRQQGYGSGERMSIEKDTVRILGGIMAGETTGAPIALLVQNLDSDKWKGNAVAPMTVPRPGHADLTGAVKYGYKDLRIALERASARETTMRVALGAVCKHFLAQFGIIVGGYVVSIGGVQADFGDMPYDERFIRAEKSELRCPVDSSAQKMHTEIEKAMHDKDTLGGVIEIIALNLPVGLGSFTQWDRRLEAKLALAILSVPAIKGIEIGDAFENAKRSGTRVHDPILIDKSILTRPSNRAGGIEGGITNGQPVVIRAAMKPVASTLTPQQSVDLATGDETPTRYERSDTCPVPRAVPVLESMIAFVLADALIEKIGGDSLSEMRPRFESLRKARLEDLPMDNHSHLFWE
jgi:chorismate synthase